MSVPREFELPRECFPAGHDGRLQLRQAFLNRRRPPCFLCSPLRDHDELGEYGGGQWNWQRIPDSLGQAVHDLRPDLSRSTVRGDVRMAKLQAEQDIDAAELAIRLSTNATLAARAQALLPAGTSLQNAAVGFEDARQFLLVEHVAHDLNISFAQLKAEVTGANPVPLKEAVSGLRPDLAAATIRSDLAVARQETKVDLQAAGVLVEEQRELARE